MAASIRVETNLPLPDALIIATAKAVGCDAIVGNDQSWSRVDAPGVLLLNDYVNAPYPQSFERVAFHFLWLIIAGKLLP